jgi:hypothetical protein
VSAHVRTDRETSADGRFTLTYDRRDDDDLWGSEIDEQWTIADARTGAEVGTWYGSKQWRASGASASGVASVAFDPDGRHAIATHHDGTVERIALEK